MPRISSPWTRCRSTWAHPPRHHPRPDSLLLRPGSNRNEVYAGGYTAYPDRPVSIWTPDQLGKGIFYHARELNDRFTSVLT